MSSDSIAPPPVGSDVQSKLKDDALPPEVSTAIANGVVKSFINSMATPFDMNAEFKKMLFEAQEEY